MPIGGISKVPTSRSVDADQSQPPRTAPAPTSPRKGPPQLPAHILQKNASFSSISRMPNQNSTSVPLPTNSFAGSVVEESSQNNSMFMPAMGGSTSQYWQNTQPSKDLTSTPSSPAGNLSGTTMNQPAQSTGATVPTSTAKADAPVSTGPPSLPQSVLKRAMSMSASQVGSARQQAPPTPRSRASGNTPREEKENVTATSAPQASFADAAPPSASMEISPIRPTSIDVQKASPTTPSSKSPSSPTRLASYKKSAGSPSTPKALSTFKTRGAIKSPLAITRDVTNGHLVYYYVTKDDGIQDDDMSHYPTHAQQLSSPSPKQGWSGARASRQPTYDAAECNPILTSTYVERLTPSRPGPRLRSIETVYE